jgi:hypothetical protein
VLSLFEGMGRALVRNGSSLEGREKLLRTRRMSPEALWGREVHRQPNLSGVARWFPCWAVASRAEREPARGFVSV